MSNITQEERESLFNRDPETASELQYLISAMVADYLTDQKVYDYVDGKNSYTYQTLNEIMGVLASIQQTFYREVVSPYEKKKESVNGPIY